MWYLRMNFFRTCKHTKKKKSNNQFHNFSLIINMSPDEAEIFELYQNLLSSFNKNLELDLVVKKKLDDKIKKIGNEELRRALEQIEEELHDELGEKGLASKTKLKIETRNRKFKVKLDEMGRILSRFLPGFECIYESHHTKETRYVDSEEEVYTKGEVHNKKE